MPHAITLFLRLCCFYLFLTTPILAEAVEPPGLLLANVYRNHIKLEDYWVSEKLDGVRARWDGERLLSRGGNVLRAPSC